MVRIWKWLYVEWLLHSPQRVYVSVSNRSNYVVHWMCRHDGNVFLPSLCSTYFEKLKRCILVFVLRLAQQEAAVLELLICVSNQVSVAPDCKFSGDFCNLSSFCVSGACHTILVGNSLDHKTVQWENGFNFKRQKNLSNLIFLGKRTLLDQIFKE